MTDWHEMTAMELGSGIGAGEIDPVELTEHFLAAIDAHPLSPRVYAHVTVDRARREAEAAAQRAQQGRRLSPLDGVPISWKDLFDSAHAPTEAGSQLLRGRVPSADAEVLRSATALGLVCLGKTHMSELAFSGLGLNPKTATPPSVNDADAVSGGSSSGAAASVAHGLAAAAIGSDTGGSVRIPAAWNDLVGFKPAHGALSVTGVVPLCASFDTVGPLTKSVADAAALYSALGAQGRFDLKSASLQGARLLVLETIAMDELEDAPRVAFKSAMQRLTEAGAHIDHAEVGAVGDAMAQAGPLYAPEAYATWEREIEATPEKMFAPILERFRSGKDVSAVAYIAAWQAIDRAKASYLAETARYDAVIVPTAPILPPNHDRLLSDDAYYKRANLLALRNTRIANLLGLAALTLPTGVPSAGISFMTPPGSEARLLRLGTAAEAALA